MNNKERLSRLIAQYQKNMEFYRNAREFMNKIVEMNL